MAALETALEPCGHDVAGMARRDAAPSSAAPLRLAYVSASPLVYTRANGSEVAVPAIDEQAELSLLREALDRAGKHVRLVAEVASAQRIRRLCTLGCDVLHYSGHGVRDGLALENDLRWAEVHVVGSERLARLMAAGGKMRTKLAFVSACHSEPSGRAFADAGVAHVVCVRQEARVSDAASRTFARQFYFALLVGKSVREAFEIGVEAASVEQPASAASSTAAKFLLLPESAAHGETLFAGALPGAFEDETRPPAPCELPTPPRPSVGRASALADAARVLAGGARCLTVVGPRGGGKSAFVAKLAECLAVRRLYGYVARAECASEAPADALDAALERTPASASVLLVVETGGADARSLVGAISALLLATRSLAVIVIGETAMHSRTTARLENEAEKVVNLEPLDARACAMLLTRLAPRRLERWCAGGADALAVSPVVAALRGSPRAIADFAPALMDRTLDRDGDALLAAARAAYAGVGVRAAPAASGLGGEFSAADRKSIV